MAMAEPTNGTLCPRLKLQLFPGKNLLENDLNLFQIMRKNLPVQV